MKDFNKSDIPALDFIINQCLTKGYSITANDLVEHGHIKLTDKKGYGTLSPEFDASKEFKRYLGIIEKYGICECVFTSDGEFARANEKTFNFQKQGGFKELFKDLKEQRKRDKLELKKSKVDLKLSEETLKDFPKTKRRAKVGYITAIVLGVFQVIEWIVKLLE